MKTETIEGWGARVDPVDEEAPPSVIINPHTTYGKELRKWEQHRTELVPRGTNPGNPYEYRAYPKMIYRAQRKPNGQYACMMPTPHPYEFTTEAEYVRAIQFKETFDVSCYAIVSDESAELVKKGQGWADSPVLAMEQREREQQAIGNAAAEVLYHAQGMTDLAKRELDAAAGQTHEHVTDVKPKRKYRRAVKEVIAMVGASEVEPE